ncbi:MAG: ABC transporter substrate-binding protein [Elusimicrobiales bacterium]|nr:ABC transporter substrate-binding protein [Elusimicrobiales bacterium]
MNKTSDTYTVSVHAYWHTLMPPLQHSLVGDAVMINQFEPLVKSGKKGLIEPLAAKAWDISADRKTIRFFIDTSRRFSDGGSLSAADFKRSWEDGLRMQPVSNNSSLVDVFANLHGMEDFKKTGALSGVKAGSDGVLELEFEKPVRSALEHLSGLRYAAYRISGGRPIGTGAYVIEEADKTLTLSPNKYYSGEAVALRRARIVPLPASEALARVKAGKVDLVLFAEKADAAPGLGGDAGPIAAAFGQEGTHLVVNLNARPGRFFSDSASRRAFQALMLKVFDKNNEAWTRSFQTEGFLRDPQSYLPFQSGRLDDGEAAAIIKEGEPGIKKLIADTAARPLLIMSGTGWDWLAGYLKEAGLSVSEKSRGDFEEKDWLKMMYKTFEPDILPARASVTEVDPDGLYHLLGRNGAIFSPMLERAAVADKLEEGRMLLEQGRIAEHYKGVSREILREVPYVHLGYLYRKVAYNPARLRLKRGLLNRDSYSLLSFEPN